MKRRKFNCNSQTEYETERYYKIIPAHEYINDFQDLNRIRKYCQECDAYGKIWSCPPYEGGRETEINNYSEVFLISVKILPKHKDFPITDSYRFIWPERIKLDRLLLYLEKRYGGKALLFGGKCFHCGEESCTRLSGAPCRHPELVRPSLEAIGFDVSRTMSEIFNMPILWSKNGVIPSYLTLVCAFFR